MQSLETLDPSARGETDTSLHVIAISAARPVIASYLTISKKYFQKCLTIFENKTFRKFPAIRYITIHVIFKDM